MANMLKNVCGCKVVEGASRHKHLFKDVQDTLINDCNSKFTTDICESIKKGEFLPNESMTYRHIPGWYWIDGDLGKGYYPDTHDDGPQDKEQRKWQQ